MRSTARLQQQLLATLGSSGPTIAADLCSRLGISQPTVSRLVQSCRDRVVVGGKSRARLYAARRAITGTPDLIPVYELRPRGEEPRHLMSLTPVAPRGFLAETLGTPSGDFHRGLPWFLDGLRPTGFLGRLDALRRPELGNPPDIRLWSDDDVLRFVTRYGWDLPGAFIVGEEAYREFLRFASSPPNLVAREKRRDAYPRIASSVLSFGSAGSSAAGEQPKFLATIRSRTGLTPVIVKFSPVVAEPVGQRMADLLWAEHLALATLRENGFLSPASSVVIAGGRTFLEVERFDRQGTLNRVGQVSLDSLDAAFVGSDQRSWGASVEKLAKLGLTDAADLDRVRWLELFGRLIGNTDMHFGNLAFFLDGERVGRLAPPYDMLPMHYFPRHQELSDDPFPLPDLSPRWAGMAAGVIQAAADFWVRLSLDDRVSPGLRGIASRDRGRVLGLCSAARLLPGCA
jgi:hypothetical protein